MNIREVAGAESFLGLWRSELIILPGREAHCCNYNNNIKRVAPVNFCVSHSYKFWHTISGYYICLFNPNGYSKTHDEEFDPSTRKHREIWHFFRLKKTQEVNPQCRQGCGIWISVFDCYVILFWEPTNNFCIITSRLICCTYFRSHQPSFQWMGRTKSPCQILLRLPTSSRSWYLRGKCYSTSLNLGLAIDIN